MIALSFAAVKIGTRSPECQNNLRTICTRGVAIWALSPVKLIKKVTFLHRHTWPFASVRTSVLMSFPPAEKPSVSLDLREAGGDRRRTGAKRKCKHAAGASFSAVAKVLCFLPLTCFAPPVLPAGEVGALSLDCRAATRAFLPAGRGISARLLFVLPSLTVPLLKCSSFLTFLLLESS